MAIKNPGSFFPGYWARMNLRVLLSSRLYCRFWNSDFISHQISRFARVADFTAGREFWLFVFYQSPCPEEFSFLGYYITNCGGMQEGREIFCNLRLCKISDTRFRKFTLVYDIKQRSAWVYACARYPMPDFANNAWFLIRCMRLSAVIRTELASLRHGPLWQR